MNAADTSRQGRGKIPCRNRFRRLAVALAGVGLALAASPGVAGAASGTETFRFVLTGDPAQMAPGRVVATGLLNAAGTSQTLAHEPNADGTETDTELLTLPAGTITLADTVTSMVCAS